MHHHIEEPRMVQGRLSLPVEWKVETGDVLVGPEGRTVLQVEALKDIAIATIRVDLPDFLDQPEGLEAQIYVVEQEPARGGQLLRVQRIGGKAQVAARQNGGASLPVEPALAFALQSPKDYWQWAGSDPKLYLVKRQAIGIVVATNVPTRCRVQVGGR